MQIVVENIRIFMEMLRIQKQSLQHLHSKGNTQIVNDIHTSLSKFILLELLSSNN